EAVTAVNRLAARRAERDLGLASAIRAGCRKHFAGSAIARAVAPATATTAAAAAVAAGAVAAAGTVAAVATTTTTATAFRAGAGSLAARSAGGAAARLRETALGIKILLGCGEDELLSTVRAGQILVVVHLDQNSSR